jgi:protein TonB
MNLPATQTIPWPVGLVSFYNRRRILCSFAMSAALHLAVLAVLFHLRDGEFRPAEFGMEARPTTLSVTWIETVAPLPAEVPPSPPPPAPVVEVPPTPAVKEPKPEPVAPAEPAQIIPQTASPDAPVAEQPAPPAAEPASVPAATESTAPVAAPTTEHTGSSEGTVTEAKPDHLHNPPPNYPRLARERCWHGTTRLRIEVLTSGLAGHIQIVNSSGYRILDEASVETVRQHWKFLPARRGNVAVDSWVEQDIVFQLRRG